MPCDRGLCGGVDAQQPIPGFGRVYAAHGGILIALALLWGIVVDGFRPDGWDLLGAAITVAGVVVMVAPQRGIRIRGFESPYFGGGPSPAAAEEA